MKLGDKIIARIQHVNHKELGTKKEIVNLVVEEDGYHFLDKNGQRTVDELSREWDIINYKVYQSNDKDT